MSPSLSKSPKAAPRDGEGVEMPEPALSVTGFGGELLDFGIDVAIANQDVRPAIIVKIKEAAAPAEILSVLAETGGECGVFEVCGAKIVIQRRSITGEIGFDDVVIAVEIIVRGGDAHTGLRFAVGTERTAGFHGDVGEFSIFAILVEGAGGGIVSDVNVRPAIVIKIGGEDAEAVGTVGGENSGG